MQSILLTGLAPAFFIAAMMLIPQVAERGSGFWGLPSRPAAPGVGDGVS
jgi:hypothetical protein